MGQYILRRTLLMIPTLFGISIVVFMMVRFIPGDVVDTILGEYGAADQELRQELRDQYDLNDSVVKQYGTWIGDIGQGDLGKSIISGRSVQGELRHRMVPSLELAAITVVLGLIIAIPIGIISATRQDTWLDYISRSTAIGFLAVPGFWLGTLVMTLPSRWWGWTPPLEYRDFTEDPVRNIYILIIPAMILALAFAGTVMRLMRAQMLEVLNQDYIRTAWSKGLRERTVISRHALKNAMIPVVTVIGLQVPVLIGGVVIVETIFGIPGIGSYLYQSILSRDYPIVQGVNLIVAVLVLASNLAVDVTYAYLDPRIRYS